MVPHPRYGRDVLVSGLEVTREEVLGSYWGYRGGTEAAVFFLESAIAADISRQDYCAFPRGYYVDLLKTCRDCERPFLFFAQEQRYWYEELGFYIDADCVRCVECRQAEHRRKFHFHRYARRVHAEAWNDDELETLVTDAVFLFNNGMLRNEQTLRRLKNLAVKRLPERAVTRAILGVISRIETRED